MSTTAPPASQFDIQEETGRSVGAAAREYWTRVKGGDMGSLPAIIGVVVLVVIFGIMEGETFLSKGNFANLINQGAAIMVLAMGLVFVLLLGEIDLSAGFAAGMGAAILATTLTERGWAWPLSLLAALADRRGDRLRDRAAGRAARDPELRRHAGVLPRPAGRDAADHRRGRDDPDPRRRDPVGDEREHAGRPRLAVRADRDRRVRGGGADADPVAQEGGPAD